MLSAYFIVMPHKRGFLCTSPLQHDYDLLHSHGILLTSNNLKSNAGSIYVSFVRSFSDAKQLVKVIGNRIKWDKTFGETKNENLLLFMLFIIVVGKKKALKDLSLRCFLRKCVHGDWEDHMYIITFLDTHCPCGWVSSEQILCNVFAESSFIVMPFSLNLLIFTSLFWKE